MTAATNSCSTGPMIRTLVISLVLLLSALSPGRAEMTDWVEVQGGAVRLISSDVLQDGHYLAGLEFLMERGWHTYWRYPGEAGIPPQISVTGSENLKALEILYPAPERYDDGFSQSIVYHDGIVLPFRVEPQSPDQEARLEIEVFFGICKDICVPGEAILALDFDPRASEDTLSARLIRRDLDAVPHSGAHDTLKVSSVSSDGSGNIVIETSVAGGSDADLFAAAPEGSFIGLPQLKDKSGDKAVWHLSKKGLARTDDDDQLRLVLTSGGEAIEHLEAIPADWISKKP